MPANSLPREHIVPVGDLTAEDMANIVYWAEWARDTIAGHWGRDQQQLLDRMRGYFDAEADLAASRDKEQR